MGAECATPALHTIAVRTGGVTNGYFQREAKREGEAPSVVGTHEKLQWLEAERSLVQFPLLLRAVTAWR